MKIVIALVVGVLGVGMAPAFACHVDPFEFKFGSDSATHVAVRDGESCRIGFRVKSHSHMDTVALAEAPRHGTLTAVDATHWIYRPAAGYTGSDQVMARISGSFMGNRSTRQGDTTITWTLDVSP